MEKKMSSLLKKISAENKSRQTETLSIEEYLKLCKKDKLAYATAYERMLNAIGEPEIIDTSQNPRLSRIYMNKPLRIYPAFRKFYGIEDTIERIVGYFVHASQGLEESKQILYLAGGVGGGKSSLAETLKSLMEKNPIYVLADENGNISPVFESPLGLFINQHEELESEFGISFRYLPKTMSPWGIKRLNEYEGNVTRFKVVKVYPSKANQLAVAKSEPLDDNNADISTLIGKVDLRKLQDFSQDDADAYAYNGGLCRGNRGITEMVEMFKSNIKTLNPLLEATQSRSFSALEPIGQIPFDGIILAHSNMTEFEAFKADRKNEAFLDRVYMVKIPYSLRYEEEKMIYQKMLNESSLSSNPCVPETLDILAKFSVISRLEEHQNSNLFSKMRVYNGENIKNEDNNAKPLMEYKDQASQDEGLSGISTRWAFKLLSKVFNEDPTEVAADPVTLFKLLEENIVREQFGKDKEEKYLGFIEKWLKPKYMEHIEKQIQRAYIESYGDYAQNKFDRYIELADAWLQDVDFRDPLTGNLYDRDMLNKELEALEKGASIYNAKDFRNEVVNFVFRERVKGKDVQWNSYKKLGDVIEKSVVQKMENMIPIITFDAKSSKQQEKEHLGFVDRMCKLGYTQKQTQKIVSWFLRSKNS
jgi:serine protein kinase